MTVEEYKKGLEDHASNTERDYYDFMNKLNAGAPVHNSVHMFKFTVGKEENFYLSNGADLEEVAVAHVEAVKLRDTLNEKIGTFNINVSLQSRVEDYDSDPDISYLVSWVVMKDINDIDLESGYAGLEVAIKSALKLRRLFLTREQKERFINGGISWDQLLAEIMR